MGHLSADTKSLYFNAFTNGVVPGAIETHYLKGRDREMDSLLHTLVLAKDRGVSSFKLVEGPYGSGKTMILSVFEKHALKEGFLVSRISLGSHNNFSKPEIIYRDIMSSLKVQADQPVCEFEDLFKEWLKETKKAQSQAEATKKIYHVISELQKYHSSFAQVLLVYIRSLINNDLELSSIAAGWIKGDYNLPYEQKKKLNIKGNIDRHNAFDILRGFSKLVHLLGYNGLVVLVDELEYILNERVDIRLKSYTSMRHLLDEIGENKWHQTVFVGAQTPEIVADKEKGYYSYEALAQRLISGFDDVGRLKDFRNLTIIPLSRTSDDTFIEIGEQIATLTDCQVNPNHLSKLALLELKKNEKSAGKEGVVREYIKYFVHLLELSNDNPQMPIFQVNR